jgi:hypothetical protein
MNSNQNATYCFLVKQSKRATSVGEVVGQQVTGDPAILDRVWTSVVARENIVVEIQIFCTVNREQTKKKFIRTALLLHRKKKWQATANKLTQIHEAIHLGWNYSNQSIAIKI